MNKLLIFYLLCFLSLSAVAQETSSSLPVPADTVPPALSAPTAPAITGRSSSIRSGDLELVQSREQFGGFVVRVAGQDMAIGQSHLQIAWLENGNLKSLDLAGAPKSKVHVLSRDDRVKVSCVFQDSGGAKWDVSQMFSTSLHMEAALFIPGALDVQVSVKVDHDRAVAFLPMFLLFPGASGFGTNKEQALFAGLEYLDNEPSSSEKDVIGPAAKREVPDNLKITFPLMAIQSSGRYVALSWRMEPQFSALFDSPDRTFNSGGHVMGLLFPGSDGQNRVEGSLLPRTARILHANQPLILQATLLGGKGESLVPAVQQYVSLQKLSRSYMPALQNYVSQAAGGWLDSKIREGDMFRHAVYPNFNAMHVADPALWMQWLATQTPQLHLAKRLDATARDVLAGVPPQDWSFASIGHNRTPAAALVFGHVAENAGHASEVGRQLLGNFEPDLSVRYHPRAGGTDLGRTHFTNEANGLTATIVCDLLEAAAFSGKAELISAALERLKAMDKFRNGVPRGAQTWEVPLHTPDILASAHLVHAYTLGYELSGEQDFLEQARYWAWTGVPFVYLREPVAEPIGLYATIAVYGATQWRAPVWLGLPVQWCGLVYAHSLYRLARYDPEGPWKTLADGITASGIEQSWPSSDTPEQGLLPDSFVLRPQHRNGPAINPGTLQACATHLFDKPVYDFRCLRQNGLQVHAPGAIEAPQETPGHASFTVAGWPGQPYFILINGLKKPPAVKINGRAAEAAASQFLEQEGRLILKVNGRAQVELDIH